MEKIDGMSRDLELEAREKLKSVFPDCFAEGKLDIDKLLNICGEYIDDDFEKYEFKWKGKNDCLKLAQRRSAGTLRPCREESVDWENTENLYIEGDNLEVLKILQSSYYRKVKTIYIDPPYNTGNDFVYEDDYKDPIERYKEVTSQTTKSNPETMGRFHTNWLNMMYPRLRLAANLLRDDGVIFISIDDNEVTNLRKICDEVFGEENFVAQIIKVGNSAKNNVKQMSITHEYCIIYAKYLSYLPNWQVVRTNAYEFQKRAEFLFKSGLKVDEIKKELRELVKYPRFYDFDHYIYCDNKGVFRANDLTAPNSKNYFDVIHPITNKPCKTGARGWAYSKEGMQELIKNDMIYFGENESIMPQLKCYLTDNLKQSPRGIMFFDSQSDTKWIKANQLGFDFPKPVDYIKQLISMCSNSNSGDLILDFFSGSATTAHAVMQLNAEDGGNRRYICVQLPELCGEKSEAYKAGYKNICEIGKERIRRAGNKILAGWKEKQSQMEIGENESPVPPDVGFKVFKLDTSNISAWDGYAVRNEGKEGLQKRIDEFLEGVKPGRTRLDVVYEIILKTGFPLTAKVETIDINGREVYSIDNETILICLFENVGFEDVEEMAQYAPAHIVFGEKCFADTSAVKNAKEALRDTGIDIKFF